MLNDVEYNFSKIFLYYFAAYVRMTLTDHPRN